MATPPTPPYQPPEPITIVNYTGITHSNVIPLQMEPIFQSIPWNTAATAKGIPFPTSHVGIPPIFSPTPLEPIAFSFYQPYQIPTVHPMYEIHVHKPAAPPPVHNNGCRTNVYHPYQFHHSYGYEMHSSNHISAVHGRLPTYAFSSGGRSVLIYNLGTDINLHTLTEHLRGAVGTVERCDILPKEETRKPGSQAKEGSSYAVATFETEEEARRAVDLCDGSLLMGRRIRVTINSDVVATAARSGSSSTSISGRASPEKTVGDLNMDALNMNKSTSTLTSTSISSSSSSTSSKMEHADSKVNNSHDHDHNGNHTESRRDSGQELLHSNNNNNNNNKQTDTQKTQNDTDERVVATTRSTAPPPPPPPSHQPLVVNGSSLRGRSKAVLIQS